MCCRVEPCARSIVVFVWLTVTEKGINVKTNAKALFHIVGESALGDVMRNVNQELDQQVTAAIKNLADATTTPDPIEWKSPFPSDTEYVRAITEHAKVIVVPKVLEQIKPMLDASNSSLNALLLQTAPALYKPLANVQATTQYQVDFSASLCVPCGANMHKIDGRVAVCRQLACAPKTLSFAVKDLEKMVLLFHVKVLVLFERIV
jgi:hypothetical protein